MNARAQVIKKNRVIDHNPCLSPGLNPFFNSGQSPAVCSDIQIV